MAPGLKINFLSSIWPFALKTDPVFILELEQAGLDGLHLDVTPGGEFFVEVPEYGGRYITTIDGAVNPG